MKRYIRASQYVTNYVDKDKLHNAISRCQEMEPFSSYSVLDNMMIETNYITKYNNVGPHGAVHKDSRLWKVSISDDGSVECCEVTEDGKVIGQYFVLMEL